MLAAVLFAGAGAAAQTSHPGLIDLSEFQDREECLHRELAKSIKTEHMTDTTLDDVARTAAQYCSQAVRARLMRASPSIAHGEELVKYDRLQTELRALAIGRELRARNQ